MIPSTTAPPAKWLAWATFLVLLACGGHSPPTSTAERVARPRPATAGTPAFILQRGHSAPVWAATFSPDGRSVATAGEDGTAKVWDTDTGALRATLEGHSDTVTSVRFSADGRWVLTASLDGAAHVWNSESGTLHVPLHGHPGGAHTASFSADGRRVLTAGEDGTAKVWDTDTGALRATLEGGAAGVTAASFSADGRRIAVASDDGTVQLWDADTGARQTTLTGHTASLWAVSFSADGRRVLTAGEDGTAKVWDADTGALRETLAGHVQAYGVRASSFSADGGHVLTGSDDGTAKVWDADTGALLATLAGHSGGVHAASFSPDARRVLTASDDGTAKVWDADTGALRATLAGHSGTVTAASFSADGRRVLTAGADGTAKVWDADTGALRVSLEGRSGGVTIASFSADGRRMVTVSGDGSLELLDVDVGALRARLAGHAGAVTAVSFSADGRRVLTAGADGTAKVWDADTGALLATLAGHSGGVRAASFSPDARRVLTASDDGTAKVWDADTGALRATLAGHSGTVTAASFSADGRRVLTAGADGTAKVWDADTGALRATLSRHSRLITAVSFSADGRRVVTASLDRTAKVWDADTGALQATLRRHGAMVHAASFSPDARRVLTASGDGTAKVWDAETGVLRATLVGHASAVRLARFSAYGRHMVTAGDDGAARVWDATTGELHATFTGHDGEVLDTWLDPTSGILSLVGQSGRIEHFRYEPDFRITGQYAVDRFRDPDGRLYSTPDGLFTGDEAAFDRVMYRLGQNILRDDLVTADQLFDYFHRPSLVEDFWSRRPMRLHPDVREGVGRPPRVEFVGIPGHAVTNETMRVRVRAFSRGGGVAEVRLFNNGARVEPVGGTRGLVVRRTGEREGATGLDYGAFECEFDVLLTPGENLLRAEAYSEIGRVRGRDATDRVTRDAPQAAPPELHMLALSLEEYTDPSMALGSPHEDASAITRAFERQRGRLFRDVHVTQLRDADATLEGVVDALEAIATRIRPQDVFVLYAAGHGGMVRCPDESAPAYRLLTHRASLQSVRSLCVEALSMPRLTVLLRGIHASKKLLILDTCQAGGAARGDALLAMASRGAEEIDAIRRLARSEGIAILAASKESEYAQESAALGHGLFTYVLLRGLDGAAVAREERTVSVFSLIGYVDRWLPDFARRFAGGEQRATTSLHGSDFPLFAIRDGDEILAPDPDGTPPASPARRHLSADVQDRIRAHIDANRTLVTACLDDAPGVVQVSVDDHGTVTFGVRGGYEGTPAEECARQALGSLRVSPGQGTMREVVRR